MSGHFRPGLSDLSDLSGEGGTDVSAAEELFRGLEEGLKVRSETLSAGAMPAVILQSETTRRFREMSRMYGQDPSVFPAEEELVINSASPLIAALAGMAGDESRRADAELLAREIRDLAKLNQAPLTAEQMKEFTARTLSILSRIADQ